MSHRNGRQEPKRRYYTACATLPFRVSEIRLCVLKWTLQTTSTILDIFSLFWSTFSHVTVVDVQGETNQASTFRPSFRFYYTNFSAVRAPPSSSILVKYFMSSSPMPLSCLIFATSDATSASLRMYFRAMAASFFSGNDSMNFVPSCNTATRTTTKRQVLLERNQLDDTKPRQTKARTLYTSFEARDDAMAFLMYWAGTRS